MRIILIIGLPGSGKTYLANKLQSGGTVIDDITDQNQLPERCERLIITDVNFCDEKLLKKACVILQSKYPGAVIDRMYFENDAKKCRRNVEYRNDGRNVEGTIRRFEKIYKIPIGYQAIKIWTL